MQADRKNKRVAKSWAVPGPPLVPGRTRPLAPWICAGAPSWDFSLACEVGFHWPALVQEWGCGEMHVLPAGRLGLPG